jgi:hypothetical protein
MEISGGKSNSIPSRATPSAARPHNREFFQVKQVEDGNSALLGLAFYSFLMFTVPVGVFFFGKILYLSWDLNPGKSLKELDALTTLNVVV